MWEVPSFRPDVAREVDLIEEVARVRGYDAIPTKLPPIVSSRDAAPRESLARRARRAAVAVGLSEAVTLAFVSPRDLDAVRAPAAGVAPIKPLRRGPPVIRPGPLPGRLPPGARAPPHR